MASIAAASKANQNTTLPAILTAAYVSTKDPNAKVDFSFVDADKLPNSGSTVALKTLDGEHNGTEAILTYFASQENLPKPLKAQVDEWLARLPKYMVTDHKSLEPALLELDAHLTLRSYVVGYSLTIADVAIWGSIKGSKVGVGAVKKGAMINLSRWYRFLEESYPWLTETCQALNASAAEKKMAASKKGGSYDIELHNVEKGVVTRFPPEPSGYLHIGHAKAALLNDYFAHEAYPGGKLICRFDDTNPSKEKEEFQDAIVEDLALMGIRPDQTSYSSDYFQLMYECCVKMIKEGKAYADDTDQETMRDERGKGIASKRRDATVEENLARFEAMKTGSEEGLRWCIRAKISVDDTQKSLRDPVIYRCNLTPHHRTGTTWKIYPTYDFCVPILDAKEGVTHALRTIEYRDHNPLYVWMQDALGLRSVQIWDFARMNFMRTLLSKRKLTKFVDSGHVWGWDDPRFPTVRGIRRRGMTIAALREFILKQGPSRNIVNMDWNQFWATNKKHIDPVAPRFTMINSQNPVTVTLRGGPETPRNEARPKHAKNPDVGTKNVVFSSKLLIDQEDAASFKKDEEITLMAWGNAIVREISHSASDASIVSSITMDLHLEGDFKTTDKKITWLSAEGQKLIKVEMFDFDFLITKEKLEEDDNFEDFLTPTTIFKSEGLTDGNALQFKKDDIIQFERKGFFRIDAAYDQDHLVAFQIPTGKAGK